MAAKLLRPLHLIPKSAGIQHTEVGDAFPYGQEQPRRPWPWTSLDSFKLGCVFLCFGVFSAGRLLRAGCYRVGGLGATAVYFHSCDGVAIRGLPLTSAAAKRFGMDSRRLIQRCTKPDAKERCEHFCTGQDF